MTPKVPLSLIGLLLYGSSSLATDIPDYPFIFVIGKAEIDTPPNIAVCTLTIRAIDQDPGRAESTVDGRLKSVLGILTANDVAPSDIESFNISKQILSTAFTEKEPAEIRGYDLTRSLQFRVRQLTSLPAIEDGFIGSPNVEQVNCQFDRTDRAAIEADLLTKAIHSAKDQAEKLAEPLGRHVTSAEAVSQVPFDSIAGKLGLGIGLAKLERMNRMFEKSMSAEDLLVPLTIPMSVWVNLLFKME
jgi:uncharacterized protein YggE